ncbi:MAG: Protein of unknown function, putative methyltransferase [Cytophagaceae bacterium]|jgi:FkbM family methyltransferase|nr:Protein of unknown function, putative methyltransferase [Cytophagaceae bacterium]
MVYSLKIVVANLLSANWVGGIIAVLFSNKIPFHGTLIHTHDPEVKNRTKALLFWRMYESSEIRFVNKYMDKTYDTIELGGSIGAVSVQLGKKIQGRKLISVEANKPLLDIQKQNLNANGIYGTQQVHAAYGSKKQQVWFSTGSENTLGKIAEAGKGNGFFVDTISLEKIVEAYQLGEYALICDIEGAEIDLLLNEQETLSKCKLLIIETHRTVYKDRVYEPEEMKALLLQMGFQLLDQHGVNFVFAK